MLNVQVGIIIQEEGDLGKWKPQLGEDREPEIALYVVNDDQPSSYICH